MLLKVSALETSKNVHITMYFSEWKKKKKLFILPVSVNERTES